MRPFPDLAAKRVSVLTNFNSVTKWPYSQTGKLNEKLPENQIPNQQSTIPDCQDIVEGLNLREKQHEKIFLPVEDISLSYKEPSLNKARETSAQWNLKF